VRIKAGFVALFLPQFGPIFWGVIEAVRRTLFLLVEPGESSILSLDTLEGLSIRYNDLITGSVDTPNQLKYASLSLDSLHLEGSFPPSCRSKPGVVLDIPGELFAIFLVLLLKSIGFLFKPE
jgi:hypothetical protein